MKKLVLTTVCALVVTGAAFAQGNLRWDSFSPANITTRTNSSLYSPLFGGGVTGGGATGVTVAGTTGTTYYFELLYFTTANTTATQLSGASAPSNSFAALFGGGWADTGGSATNAAASTIVGSPTVSGLTVAGMTPFTVSNNIVLVGWSANLGSTWAAASNTLANWNFSIADAFFGVSAAGFTSPVGSATAPGATVFGSANTANGKPIQSLNTTLYLMPTAVPEPSTLALAGLGGLSLMLFRRRK